MKLKHEVNDLALFSIAYRTTYRMQVTFHMKCNRC